MPEGAHVPSAAAAATPSPELVFESLNAFQRTAALKAAIELDLFTAIGEGCTDVPSLAARCEGSERGIRILADYLVVQGLLAKRDGAYQHTPTSAAFLDRRSPYCIAASVGFLSHPGVTDAFADLTAIIRRGRESLPVAVTESENNPVWVEFAHSMAPMMALAAGSLGRIILADGAGPMRVLDIAAGHGLFGIEVAKQNPEAVVVAQDWPAVLEVARENAARAGVLDRYALLPGNAFEVDFGAPYDVVLLTNFLHHFDAPTCVRILQKVRAALRPGGRASALEFVPNDDRISPPIPAAFSLVMLAGTRGGDAYTYRELDGMFRHAGFARTALQPLPSSPHTVVTGYTA
jgi:SAM-dependent methyltransferase